MGLQSKVARKFVPGNDFRKYINETLTWNELKISLPNASQSVVICGFK